MNKLLLLICKIPVLFAVMLIAACETEHDPAYEIVPNGGFVRFDGITTPVIDVTDLENSAYTAELVAPGDNVTKYDLYVSIFSQGESTDTVLLKTLTTFPTTLTVSAPEVVAALGMPLDSIKAGDRFDMYAEVQDERGRVFTSDDFTGDLFNPGQRQAMQFATFVSCSFDASEAAGNYLITRDDFGTTLAPATPIIAEAGPGENQVTFKNLFSHPEGYDVVVTVDPVTGIATIPRQPAWHCDNFGCGFGEGRIDGSGFFFSCSGFLTVDVEHTVDAGSFGTYRLELTKQ